MFVHIAVYAVVIVIHFFSPLLFFFYQICGWHKPKRGPLQLWRTPVGASRISLNLLLNSNYADRRLAMDDSF